MTYYNNTRPFSDAQITFMYSIIQKKISYAMRVDSGYHVSRYLNMLKNYSGEDEDDALNSFIEAAMKCEDEVGYSNSIEFNRMRMNTSEQNIKLAFYRFLRRRVEAAKNQKQLLNNNAEIIRMNMPQNYIKIQQQIKFTAEEQSIIMWRLGQIEMDELKEKLGCSRETIQRRWKALKIKIANEME